jgi:murein DD-endopeptidase MepM/ murein hydrolase activator NlpD
MPDALLSVLFALVTDRGATVRTATAPVAVVRAASELAPAAGWVAPLGPPLVVLRRFEPPPQATPWLPGHRGVDLAGLAGAAVRSDAAGRVTFAGRVAGQGVVVVTHSSWLRSTFEPVLATVRVGEQVRAGAQIGRLQVSPGPNVWGPSCPGRPCLHWGMRLGGRYVDPLVTSGLQPASAVGAARLLPLDLRLGRGSEGSSDSRVGREVAFALALGGGPSGPPGGGAVLAVSAAAGAVGAGSAAIVTRTRRRRVS